MKVEHRYDKVPCFGSDPKVDIELLKRINRAGEQSPARPLHPVIAIIAVATSTVAFIILFVTLIRYIN